MIYEVSNVHCLRVWILESYRIILKSVLSYAIFMILEKVMATHSSVPAWRIPGMEEPGGLPSMRSHRVGHN